MPDLSDSEVVLLGPEERDGINYLAVTKQVVTSGLSLTLNRHKLLAEIRIRFLPIVQRKTLTDCLQARKIIRRRFGHPFVF